MAKKNTAEKTREETFDGEGFTASVIGSTLTIIVDLENDGGPSGSGKSIVIATSAGNIEVPRSGGAKLGLNVYRRR